MADLYFHKFLVTDQVFYRSLHSFALVNIRPILPGHVLVVSNRHVSRLNALTDEESVDYMRTIQKVSKLIQEQYRADALNISIQDGVYAGQSVPHLHTHIIPRYKVNNCGDDIYMKLENFNNDLKKSALLEELKKLEDPQPVNWGNTSTARVNRTPQDMHSEAHKLAAVLAGSRNNF